ncbi:cupin domain-containing protein [Paenibacillus whitsoniae]|uniref:Cupin domain-containing protein n=1 Tax=Paenibacillus whitsoniae TaxID=2496558 RepID=A0A3S0IFD2_9BACL|nr:cupin domain-containing protein [Paenibacillus whitsoniae]RTE11734.1 cupin domain-containing protein [Paenibacillus whitsoniae]
MFDYDEHRTIENPMIGDRVTFVRTSAETDGEYELVRVVLQPGGGTPLHYHTAFSEQFEVEEGQLGMVCDGRTIVLLPGDSVVSSIGSIHRFYNDSTEPVVFLTTVRPARYFEYFLRLSYGLARDGKLRSNGIPKSLLDAAVFFHWGETYMPNVSLKVQKAIFGTLYRIARMLNVEKKLMKAYLNG